MDHCETAKLFKAFCDERRLEILDQLRSGEKCAKDLIEQLDIGQSTLSHHMKILCDSGVVSLRKRGKYAYYSINAAEGSHIKEVIDALVKIEGYKSRGRKEI
ncbi:ArsR/SmtB family transcription factor [Mordavella massiliensis]|uniref:Winged helix-turn-helix transcriptional regulator n=1 Tax=Mordavella massiliensis TaxID=1871024 RepID=A0A939BGX3_9CLOT|nr:metalloregulator ArsR/SmtB family transcription factor [Mordavella massiliensis]MBM6948191.1 winged helix-turn-helix transcriptional regulator [Mordavella massiliensis]